ncbi:MAG: biopolymer transporter ExbD [Chitinophagales bacterium]
MAIKSRNKVEPSFSMSSLTDIIFLLLIFFMLTSTLVSPNALNLVLPSSNTQSLAPQSISVEINKSLEYAVDGKKVPLSQVRTLVNKKVSTLEDPTVVLSADKSVPIENVVEIMNIANDLKIKLILATKPK